MKKFIFLISLITIGIVFFSYTDDKVLDETIKLNETTKLINIDFPNYSSSLDLGLSCNADCLFNSCESSMENCVCQCNFFKCKCESVEDEVAARVSMNFVQYKRTRLLASVLKSLDDKNAQLAYNNLVVMVLKLKEKDQDSFYLERSHFITNLNAMSDKSKEILNDFFEAVGAEERV